MALIHQGTRDTLQAIDIADINDNDTAIIYFQSRSRTFTFDNASTEAEKIVRPGPFYLRPHDYSTAGVWVETIGNDYDVFNAGQLIGSKLTSSNWGLSLGSEFDLDAGTIKLGGSAIPEFSVTAAGILTATGATIAGTITATAGAIGGWEIGADTLEASSGEVGLSSAVTGWDDIRIWAGHATPSSAPFKVTESGALTASSGAIGGFTLGATTLTATDLILDSGNQRIKLGSGNDLIALDADDATYRLTIGHATYASAPFRVTKAGVLTAIGATISGSLTSGALTATGGTIGGFTINSTAGLYAGSGATRVQMKPGVGIWTGATAQTDAKNYLDVDGSGWLADGNISWTAAGLLTQTLADGGSITLDAGADITLEGDDAIGDKGIIQFGDDVRMGAIDSTPFFGIWTETMASSRFMIGCEPKYVGSPTFDLKEFNQITMYADGQVSMSASSSGAGTAATIDASSDTTSGDCSFTTKHDGGTQLVAHMVHASSAINYIAHFVRVANVTKVPLLVEHQDVTITADLYVSGDVSALTFTDRTPFYEGDAIAEIKKIKGNGGEIDHESLPGFVKKIIRKKAKVDHASLSGLSGKTAREKAIKESVNKTATEIVVRDIGAMVSMLTVAIQQVSDRLDILERGR